jgi:heme/copper-type cytochrome/quinol oxidase subunit 2
MHVILAEAAKNYFWLPKQASTVARSTDDLFNVILWINIFFFLLVTVLLVAFVIKYRHKPGEKRDVSASHSMTLEISWTVIPSIIVVFLYYYGFKQYMNLAVEPPNAYTVNVNGRMWQWTFAYPNGYSDGELHVPVNVPVRCVLESSDVIHSLSIPAFRVKKDVVPGRYNRLWFQATSADGAFYLTTLNLGGHPTEFAFDENGERAAEVGASTPSERIETFGKLAKPLQDAILAQANGAKISPEQPVRVYRLLNGIEVNAIDIGQGDKRAEVLVDQDGKPPEKQTVTFGTLAPAIQATMRRQAQGTEISESQPVLYFKDAEPFEIYCADYCGTNHSTMHSRVIVHRTQADFDAWLVRETKRSESGPPEVRGQRLYARLGCAGCHSVDGTKVTGPSWKDLYGSTQQFTDGTTAVVNEEFLHGFLPAPTARIPVGFPPVMPPFPPTVVSPEQVDQIAAYMKTISKFAPPKSMGGGAGVGTTRPSTRPASKPAQPAAPTPGKQTPGK